MNLCLRGDQSTVIVVAQIAIGLATLGADRLFLTGSGAAVVTAVHVVNGAAGIVAGVIIILAVGMGLGLDCILITGGTLDRRGAVAVVCFGSMLLLGRGGNGAADGTLDRRGAVAVILAGDMGRCRFGNDLAADRANQIHGAVGMLVFIAAVVAGDADLDFRCDIAVCIDNGKPVVIKIAAHGGQNADAFAHGQAGDRHAIAVVPRRTAGRMQAARDCDAAVGIYTIAVTPRRTAGGSQAARNCDAAGGMYTIASVLRRAAGGSQAARDFDAAVGTYTIAVILRRAAGGSQAAVREGNRAAGIYTMAFVCRTAGDGQAVVQTVCVDNNIALGIQAVAYGHICAACMGNAAVTLADQMEGLCTAIVNGRAIIDGCTTPSGFFPCMARALVGVAVKGQGVGCVIIGGCTTLAIGNGRILVCKLYTADPEVIRGEQTLHCHGDRDIILRHGEGIGAAGKRAVHGAAIGYCGYRLQFTARIGCDGQRDFCAFSIEACAGDRAADILFIDAVKRGCNGIARADLDIVGNLVTAVQNITVGYFAAHGSQNAKAACKGDAFAINHAASFDRLICLLLCLGDYAAAVDHSRSFYT